MISGKCPCSLGFHPLRGSPHGDAEQVKHQERPWMGFPQNFIKAKPFLRPTNFAQNVSAGVSESPQELGEAVLAFSVHCCKVLQQKDTCMHLQGAADPAEPRGGQLHLRREVMLSLLLCPGSPGAGGESQLVAPQAPGKVPFCSRQKLRGYNLLNIPPLTNCTLQ